MARYRSLDYIRTGLEHHPATRAWSQCAGATQPPAFIEVIKEQRSDSHKSGVYRLGSLGPGGSSIIAKRTRPYTIRLESLILEEILPRTSVSHPRSYGQWEEPGGDFAWIFLEDVGEDHYVPGDPAHRYLATRWLAEVHLSTEATPALKLLPAQDPARYGEHLDSCRHRIRACLDNPVLESHHRTVVASILSHLSIVESHWERLLEITSWVPCTLVHGDFKPKNIRLRRAGDGHELLVFDWGGAGRGSPAVDLLRLDLPTYFSLVAPVWGGLNLDRLRDLRNVGDLFACLVAIDWDSRRLESTWVHRAMRHLVHYDSRLASAILALELPR